MGRRWGRHSTARSVASPGTPFARVGLGTPESPTAAHCVVGVTGGAGSLRLFKAHAWVLLTLPLWVPAALRDWGQQPHAGPAEPELGFPTAGRGQGLQGRFRGQHPGPALVPCTLVPGPYSREPQAASPSPGGPCLTAVPPLPAGAVVAAPRSPPISVKNPVGDRGFRFADLLMKNLCFVL